MLYFTHAHQFDALTDFSSNCKALMKDNNTTIIIIIIHVIKTNNKELQFLQKYLIGINSQLMAALIGQQHHLVRKWLIIILYTDMYNHQLVSVKVFQPGFLSQAHLLGLQT